VYPSLFNKRYKRKDKVVSASVPVHPGFRLCLETQQRWYRKRDTASENSIHVVTLCFILFSTINQWS